jgi:hypothetical protein
MRRIFLMASMVAVVFALWAVSAYACQSEGHSICAPAANSPNNPGNGGNNQAGPPEFKTTVPSNKGTDDHASQKSPAFDTCSPY